MLRYTNANDSNVDSMHILIQSHVCTFPIHIFVYVSFFTVATFLLHQTIVGVITVHWQMPETLKKLL